MLDLFLIKYVIVMLCYLTAPAEEYQTKSVYFNLLFAILELLAYYKNGSPDPVVS